MDKRKQELERWLRTLFDLHPEFSGTIDARFVFRGGCLSGGISREEFECGEETAIRARTAELNWKGLSELR